MYQKIFIASDHAGLSLKKALIELNPELPWQDLGTSDETSVDYPDYADKVALKLKPLNDQFKDEKKCGILICGSGQGMAIRANKYSYIRAALCWTAEIAKLSREHNNANILCMGSRTTEPSVAQAILTTFLQTPFAGGRHEQRVTKLSKNC
ncbi:MAG: ribose 5-phosphate isomerase B [Bdellovibrionales bacterium]|nr:ribose 5-phosphate isomerase B [Bdellovibrionales bacterium]